MEAFWMVLAILFPIAAAFATGAMWGACRTRRSVRRRDDAAQFKAGDVVTFGDGSRIVIASLPPKEVA